MSPREMVRLAKSLASKSDRDADEALRRQHLDATDRVSVKLEIQAQASQRRISAALATDTAEYHVGQRPANETQRLLVRAGFKLGQRYGQADVDRLLQEAALDPTQKIACRLELQELNMTAAAEGAPRRLHAMRASAERPKGKLLTDRQGQPLVLRSIPD